MISQVHGEKLRIDSWTGEAFNGEGFKIPVKENGQKWKGCYLCPSIALAALQDFGNQANPKTGKKIDPEAYKQLMDIFQNSIRKKDGYTGTHLIKAAPFYKELVKYGGTKTFEQFCQEIGAVEEFNNFYQVIPKTPLVKTDEDGSSSEAEGDKKKPYSNKPKQWFVSRVNEADKGNGDIVPFKSIEVPRSCSAFISFIREQLNPTDLNTCILYLHPTNDTIFGIGNPAFYRTGQTNATATRLLSTKTNNTITFGSVNLFHKNEIKNTQKKRQNKKEPVDVDITVEKDKTEKSEVKKKKPASPIQKRKNSTNQVPPQAINNVVNGLNNMEI